MQSRLFIVGVSAILAALGAWSNPVFAVCTGQGDCQVAQYCQKAVGDCDGSGECADLPLVCPQNYDPVCGCDGDTYSNSCIASQAGVNVAYAGACFCSNNGDCDSGEFCLKDDGACSGQGVCTLEPEFCPLVFEPVCGCDNADYNNACFANQAGTTVAYDGACQATCQGNADCMAWEYCNSSHNGCGGSGICQLRPDLCTEIYDPVCGCNELTIDNACFAAKMGVTAFSTGACGPCPFDPSTDCLFSDGTESGGLTRWSSAVGD